MYPDHRPISNEKKKDLLKLLVYIQPIYHEFYRNIIDTTSVTSHIYENEMLNDTEDESEENQFDVESDPETIVEENEQNTEIVTEVQASDKLSTLEQHEENSRLHSFPVGSKRSAKQRSKVQIKIRSTLQSRVETQSSKKEDQVKTKTN